MEMPNKFSNRIPRAMEARDSAITRTSYYENVITPISVSFALIVLIIICCTYYWGICCFKKRQRQLQREASINYGPLIKCPPSIVEQPFQRPRYPTQYFSVAGKYLLTRFTPYRLHSPCFLSVDDSGWRGFNFRILSFREGD